MGWAICRRLVARFRGSIRDLGEAAFGISRKRIRSVYGFENLSFQRSKKLAASVVRYKRNAKSAGVMADVVLLNMRSLEAFSLGVQHLRPTVVALSPDVSTIAVASADGVIHLMTVALPWARGNFAPKIERLLDSKMDGVGRLLYSPDGKKLAAINDQSVCVWSIHDGRKLHQHQHHGATIRSSKKALAFTRNSRNIIFDQRDWRSIHPEYSFRRHPAVDCSK